MSMLDWQAQHAWLRRLGFGFLLLLAGGPVAGWGLNWAETRHAQLAAEQTRLAGTVRRFDADMQLAQKPEGQLGTEDINRLLAPVNRLRVVAELERQAAAMRFSHFTYTLTPETKPKTEAPDGLPLAESNLTVAADVPLDSDAAAFLQSLSEVLPGRARLMRVALSRPNADGPPSLTGLHIEADIDWLSNEAAKGGAAP